MKTLQKLVINPEKVIKNEELINLRGGYPSCDPDAGLMCYGNCMKISGVSGTCTPTLNGCVCQ